MAKPRSIKLSFFLCILPLVSTLAFAAGPKPRQVNPKEKCPVCGMFVAKYPGFAAQIQFRDGLTMHFDGAKDMFKYYLNLARYAPGKRSSDIRAIFVTDYYTLNLVEGMSACYVTGSDVFGPMGRELIPFFRETEAREFIKDHNGKSLVRFRNVDREVIRALD